MTDKESPGAAGAAHRAIEIDELDGRVVSESKRLQDFDQAPIRAMLIGSDRCEVNSLVAGGRASVLSLCRALLAAQQPSIGKPCFFIMVRGARRGRPMPYSTIILGW